MGPNHDAYMKEAIDDIYQRYVITADTEDQCDPAVIGEYQSLVRDMLTYRMGDRPHFKTLLPRMDTLFSPAERHSNDSVYLNLHRVIQMLN